MKRPRSAAGPSLQQEMRRQAVPREPKLVQAESGHS